MSLSPDALGQRIDALGADGNTWMDPSSVLALASAPTTDTQMLTQARALTSAAQDQTVATPLVSHSPVDTAQYSSGDQLVQTVHTIVGAPRFSVNDLGGVQQALVNHGYGQGLSPNGVWNPDWQSAYSQFASDARAQYYQGQGQLLTERTKAVLNELMHSFSVSGALGSLWGFVKSIPHDVRQAAADAVGAVEGTGSLVGREIQGAVTGTAYSGKGQSSIFGSAEHDALTGTGFVQGKTEQQEHAQFTDANGNWDWGRVAGRVVDDVGTALLFVPVAGQLSAAAKGGIVLSRTAAEQGALGVLKTGLTLGAKEEAQRAPGTLVRTLINDGTTPGLLNREAVANVPLLGRVGPALGKAFAPDSPYYRLRSLLATPYRIPLVRASGTALQKGILLGAEARGVGALSSAVGGDPNAPLNYDVAHSDIDPYVVRLGFLKPLGLDSALNDLGLVLHPPIPTKTGEGVASKLVSDQVSAATQHVGNLMGGPLSPLGSYQRAVQLVTGHLPTYEELKEQAGGETQLHDFLNAKFSQHAAAQAAEHDLATDETAPTQSTTAEATTWLHQRANEIQSDPVRMSEAWSRLASEPHEAVKRLFREMTDSAMDLEHAKGNGLAQFMNGNYALRAVLSDPDLRSQLITPEAHAMRAAEQDLATAQQIGPLAAGERRADPDAALSAGFLKQANINQTRASIGLARTTTKTRGDIERWQQGLQDKWDTDYGPRYQAATASGDHQALLALDEQTRPWLSDAIRTITEATGTDYTKVSQLLHSASGEKGFEQLSALINDRKQLLASDVFPAMGADPQVRAMFDGVKNAGYKVVYGTGIGHAAETPVHYGDLGDAINRTKRVFGALGLDVGRTSQTTAGAMARIGAKQELQRLLDDPKTLPSVSSSLYTPDTILGILERGAGEEPKPAGDIPFGLRVAQAIGSPLRKREVRAVLTSEDKTRTVEGKIPGRTKQVAEPSDVAQRLHDMAQVQAQTLGLRDLKRSDVVNALTNPERIPWLLGDDGLRLSDGTVPGALSKADANRVYDAILSGFTHRPGYMLGTQHLEDVFRAGMGFFGSTLQQALPAPLESFATGLLRLPNRYYQAQSRLRFQLSPMFDARRVAKTNVKFGAYGIRPVLDPAHALLSEGGPAAYRDAHALLDKVWPEQALSNRAWLDANDQILSQASAYGMFNPRQFAAWAVHDMAQQGRSTSEMRDILDKAMTYGNRTALERTANTVFFPFSFDKTLYRSIGGYMLDHPTQSLIMLRAFNAYDTWAQQHADNPASYRWWQEHAPVLNEAARLNAFTHGIGPGELGGINAPVLNAFLPQKYPASSKSQNLLSRFIPALNDMQRVLNESIATGKDFHHEAQGALYRTEIILGQRKATPLNSPASSVAPQYALDDALKYKAQLTDALAQILTYNRANPDGKYTWPTSDQVPANVRGLPIDSTSISLLVQHRYPSFNPGKAVQIAEQRRLTLDSTIAEHANDPAWSGIAGFARDVDSLATKVRDESEDPKTLADYTTQLRTYAAQVAAASPDFKALYAKAFAHILGPLGSA